jgi:purine-binding chemotaxis protein CheW
VNKTEETAGDEGTEYVTVMIGEQLFGLPISRVQDVFVPDRLTRVPLAPPDVAGILNLRGRIITVLEMRTRLDLEKRANGQPVIALGVEMRGESYGVLVDSVGEVLKLSKHACEAKPPNLDPRLARVATGVVRLDGKLLVLLDIERVLDTKNAAVAA